MEIIVGKTAGFCYGVKRAVEGTKEEVEKENKTVYCLGEIVHNRQVIEELEKEGVKFIDKIEDANKKMIIRAHGVTKEVYQKAIKMNIELVDYTCPNVLKIHEIADEYSKNGYYIFLCGNEKHPENIGTMSYCRKFFSIIEKENDVYNALEQLKKSKLKKVLLISQTTYSLEKFNIIEGILNNKLESKIEFIVKNTICKATELRQKETTKISKNVDYMIIIGGVNSSNTKKLYDIAKKNCNSCICIETVKELNFEIIKDYGRIGIMAGASTPKKNIEEVVDKLTQVNNSNLQVMV